MSLLSHVLGFGELGICQFCCFRVDSQFLRYRGTNTSVFLVPGVSNQECVGKAGSESPESSGCGAWVDHNSSELERQWPSLCPPGLHVPLCFSNSMVWHKALHLFEPQFSHL